MFSHRSAAVGARRAACRTGGLPRAEGCVNLRAGALSAAESRARALGVDRPPNGLGAAVSSLANLRTGSVDAVPPCFRDAAGTASTTAGRRRAIGIVAERSSGSSAGRMRFVANAIAAGHQ